MRNPARVESRLPRLGARMCVERGSARGCRRGNRGVINARNSVLLVDRRPQEFALQKLSAPCLACPSALTVCFSTGRDAKARFRSGFAPSPIRFETVYSRSLSGATTPVRVEFLPLMFVPVSPLLIVAAFRKFIVMQSSATRGGATI